MEAPKCRVCGVREFYHLCQREDRLAAHREGEERVVLAGLSEAERLERKRVQNLARVKRYRAQRREG